MTHTTEGTAHVGRPAPAGDETMAEARGAVRVGLHLDRELLAHLDALAATYHGGNRSLAAEWLLAVGAIVREDPASHGREPGEALAAYVAGLTGS